MSGVCLSCLSCSSQDPNLQRVEFVCFDKERPVLSVLQNKVLTHALSRTQLVQLLGWQTLDDSQFSQRKKL